MVKLADALDSRSSSGIRSEGSTPSADTKSLGVLLVAPSRRQLDYFRLAKRAASKSSARIKIGSVVVSGGRPLSFGCNVQKLNRDIARVGYWTLHAEVAACLGIDERTLRGASVYNYRETRDGRIADSKPCGLCQETLRALGIARVFFTMRSSPYYGVMRL